MRNLLIIAVVAWLLFFNGMSYIKSFMGSNNLQSVPATVIKGAAAVAGGATAPDSTGGVATAQRPAVNVVARPSGQGGQVVVVPQGMPDLPTAVPEPTSVPPTPEPTPVQIMEDPEDTNYPAAPLNEPVAQWAMHWVPTRDGKSTQDCLYYYNIMQRYCWAPGYHPGPDVVEQTLHDMKDGLIPTEPINSYG